MRHVTTCLLALLLAAAACAAPAPTPRRARPPRVPVTCAMHWNGADFRAVFSPDGSYSAAAEGPYGTRWVGRWRLNYRTLVIAERLESCPDAAAHEYAIAMDRRLREGTLPGGGAFRLSE